MRCSRACEPQASDPRCQGSTAAARQLLETLTQAAFVARRSDTWQRLDALLKRVERRGVRALSPDEIFELGRLYRAATSDLAYAQGRGYDRALLEYLNRCVARAHAHVYARAPESSMRAHRRISTLTSFRKSFAGRFPTSRSARRSRLRARLSRTCWCALIRRTRTRCCRSRSSPNRSARACTTRTSPSIRASRPAMSATHHHEQRQGRDHRVCRLRLRSARSRSTSSPSTA